jgi:hypothetical protein
MPAVGFVLVSSLNLDKRITEQVKRCESYYGFTPKFMLYSPNLQNQLPTVVGIRRYVDSDLSPSMIVLSDSKNF